MKETDREKLCDPRPGYDYGEGPCADCEDPCDGAFGGCLAWDLWLRHFGRRVNLSYWILFKIERWLNRHGWFYHNAPPAAF